MSINLTTFVANAANLIVMDQFGGVWTPRGRASKWFGDELALIQVGDAQPADQERGAYEWYPLTIKGELCGDLRDTADGFHIYAA